MMKRMLLIVTLALTLFAGAGTGSALAYTDPGGVGGSRYFHNCHYGIRGEVQYAWINGHTYQYTCLPYYYDFRYGGPYTCDWSGDYNDWCITGRW